VSLKAPKRIRLSSEKISTRKKLKVTIQNRGDFDEIIPSAEMLSRLVTVTVTSLGQCPSPVVVLAKVPKFPKRLRPGKKIKFSCTVEFDCANDPDKSSKLTAHDDFSVSAFVDRSVLDGLPDSFPDDDRAPHLPLGNSQEQLSGSLTGELGPN